jgi:hypothetical protein
MSHIFLTYELRVSSKNLTIFEQSLGKFGEVSRDNYNGYETGGVIDFENMKNARECYEFMNLNNGEFDRISDISVTIDYEPDLPLLQYIGCELLSNDINLNVIFSTYIQKSLSKKNILKLQKDLIDNGFTGNAYYDPGK